MSQLHRFQLCKKCITQKSLLDSCVGIRGCRNISHSTILQKRQQRPYQPKLQPFENFGMTHRLVRGESKDFKRYGPLFDKPDYTFLDGRPTPLTPEQREEREKRKLWANQVMKGIKEIKDVKDFNVQKQEMDQEYLRQLADKRLKPKS
ncbi:39S ribosomal protein L52 [Mactra antiquata]